MEALLLQIAADLVVAVDRFLMWEGNSDDDPTGERQMYWHNVMVDAVGAYNQARAEGLG